MTGGLRRKGWIGGRTRPADPPPIEIPEADDGQAKEPAQDAPGSTIAKPDAEVATNADRVKLVVWPRRACPYCDAEHPRMYGRKGRVSYYRCRDCDRKFRVMQPAEKGQSGLTETDSG